MSRRRVNPVRLLIVVDHEIMRVGLRTLLGRFPSIEVIGEAHRVATAISETQRLTPDVVLMEIRLPDGSGFEACRQIKNLRIDSRIMILTSVGDNAVVSEAITAGANGYLLDTIDGEGLVSAIEKVAAGQSVLDPAVTGRVLGMGRHGSEPARQDKLSSLSAQELRVIAGVAEGKTNKQIAADLGLSEKTVKNYFSNVLDKLQLSRRSQAAAYFVQHSPR